MHEMAITQGIVDICEQHAGGRTVTAVVLEIGMLSGVVPEAVTFCFEACSSGTVAEGAQLQIEQLPGQGRCLACQREQRIERLFDPCRHCGSYQIEVVGGEELRVREIEVED